MQWKGGDPETEGTGVEYPGNHTEGQWWRSMENRTGVLETRLGGQRARPWDHIGGQLVKDFGTHSKSIQSLDHSSVQLEIPKQKPKLHFLSLGEHMLIDKESAGKPAVRYLGFLHKWCPFTRVYLYFYSLSLEAIVAILEYQSRLEELHFIVKWLHPDNYIMAFRDTWSIFIIYQEESWRN